MSDLNDRLPALRAELECGWDTKRAARVRAGLPGRRRARIARHSAVIGAISAAALVLIWLGRRGEVLAPVTIADVHEPAIERAVEPERSQRLSDGTKVVGAPGADFRIALPAVGVPDVEIDGGEVRFERPAGGTNPLVVAVGSVRIEALRATFAANRTDSRLNLVVSQGEVWILVDGERRWLGAGARTRIELPQAGSAAATVAASAGATSPPVPGRAHQRRPAAPTEPPGRAKLRDTADASSTAQNRSDDPSSPPEDSIDSALAAADAARRARQPDRAASLLEAALSSHERDPRAPLVAFTLARLYVGELDRTRDGAAAFARARALAPDGPLAEDALAREMQALAAVGDAARAGELALAYLERYPRGRWAAAAAAIGGRR